VRQVAKTGAGLVQNSAMLLVTHCNRRLLFENTDEYGRSSSDVVALATFADVAHRERQHLGWAVCGKRTFRSNLLPFCALRAPPRA
jgi:hypothetical protein